MPTLRTKQELAASARAFAISYDIVTYMGQLYMPVDFKQLSPQPANVEETIWIPLDPEVMRLMANSMLNVLFATDAEERSFKHMVRQFSTRIEVADTLLFNYNDEYVAVLAEDGTYSKSEGVFSPNYISTPYSPDPENSKKLFAVISEWVGGDENARSLLYHLATALQIKWSAVRYVLLIGKGSNGKGLLIKMLESFFGENNLSHVQRTQMSAQRPIIRSLNGKLMNLVFDGPKTFLKDSSAEKTLVAGEPLSIEMKYENEPVKIQTKALFVESVNKEPGNSDKSDGYHRRIVRFGFNKLYARDDKFERQMLSRENLSALFHLLLEHWVNADEIAEKLTETLTSLDMKMDTIWNDTPMLRFLEYTIHRDSKFVRDLYEGLVSVETLITAYRLWLENNGYKNLEDSILLQHVAENFSTERKSMRVNNKPTTRRMVTAPNSDAKNVIELLLQSVAEEESVILED